ncbi:hypothetical protein [Metabacillus malikii]|uniref:Uncharacterized protein n=1 Tax=Metabacillus malikii TaxID=1504265 RepID=A0ABT9ZD24_9BACI|nr:hypothetical protein [Metabacillus malikii]MDQ0229747.1 hypothetical protein [Metabacillus malikii]
MKALVVKKYFLDVQERERLEKEIIHYQSDIQEETILSWDDEELLERINIAKNCKEHVFNQ